MKTVFILAGFDLHNTAADSEFNYLRQGLANKRYNVVPVNIDWYRKNASEYISEFKKFYSRRATGHNIVVGNSFGAVIALLSAPVLQPDEIYLCSLSPYFKEDQIKREDPTGIRYFGKKRLNDLRTYSADEAAKLLNKTAIKTYVIYGEKEHVTSPVLVNRCEDTAAKIKNSKLIEIAGAPHDMSDSIYSAALIDMV